MGKIEYAIGIDPGHKNGVAIWHIPTQKICVVYTLTRVQMLHWLQRSRNGEFGDTPNMAIFYAAESEIWLEDPNLIKTIYARHNKAGNVGLNIAQKVGMNKEFASLVNLWAQDHGYKVNLVKPAGKKWNAAQVKQFYKGKTNEHVRDAIRLVVGR